MKIVIDATPIGVVTPDRGGVYRYILQLVEALNRTAGDDEFRLFFNFFRGRHAAAMAVTLERLRLSGNFTTRVARIPPSVWLPLGMPAEMVAGRFDVFHNCIDRLPRMLFGKGVVTVHDVRYLEAALPPVDRDALRWLHESPEWLADYTNRTRHLGELKATIARTVSNASRIIAVSSFTKDRLVTCLGADPGKIAVIPHGIDARYRPQPDERVEQARLRYRLPSRYLVYVGKLDPWKDLVTLFEAMRLIDDPSLRLVIAGPLNWYKRYLDERIRALGLEARIHYTGFVAEEDLPAIYSGAACAVLPSLYEGFGFPVLEAMACGTPVVATQVGAVPEVAAGCAGLVAPQDAASLAKAVERMILARRQAVIERGLQRAASFNWERCARETLQQYHLAAS